MDRSQAIMIYLYLKTHNISGLKYLGKTEQDPHTYSGSGRVWKDHLKKYGTKDITTQILLETKDPAEIKKMGLYYSDLWNIVENKEFANLVPEEGSGGNTSSADNYIKAMKERRDYSGVNNPNYGKKASPNIRLAVALTNLPYTEYNIVTPDGKEFTILGKKEIEKFCTKFDISYQSLTHLARTNKLAAGGKLVGWKITQRKLK